MSEKNEHGEKPTLQLGGAGEEMSGGKEEGHLQEELSGFA